MKVKNFKSLFTALYAALFTALCLFSGAAHAAAVLDKSGDEELQKMIKDNVKKFRQLTYSENGVNVPCNLFLPEDYPGNKKYPLVIFIADESTVGKEPSASLTQGWGGIVWADDDEQKKHECIVIVPNYPKKIVDDKTGKTAAEYIALTENLIRSLVEGFQVDTKKVYATGQGMGCMALMIIADKNPDLFAAELFVSGQGILPSINGLKSQKFFYLVAEGDTAAAAAQRDLIRKFEAAGVPLSRTQQWNARMPHEEYERAINALIAGRPLANFVRFIKYSIFPDSEHPDIVKVSGGKLTQDELSHLLSFDAAYRIDALRDWLFMQHKK